MPVNTGPDINTYGIPEVSLSNTFNAWRDISNISAYKLNKLKIYDGLSTASIDTTTTVAGVLQPVLLPTVLSGHTFAGGIAGTTATFSGLLRANSGISCDGGMTVSGDLAVGGGDITTSSAAASLFNTTATNLSIGGAATGITIGSSSPNSVTTIQSATTYFSGNLVIGGTATSINTNNLFIEDTVITLGVCGGVGVTTDTSRDRGVEFYWYESGQYATLGFFGFDRSTENFTFYSKGVTSPNGIYSGVTGTFQGNFLGGGITATNLYVNSLGTFIGGITASGITATTVTATTLNVLGAANVNRMILGSASTGGIVMNVKGKTKYTPGNTFGTPDSQVDIFREYRDLLHIQLQVGNTYGMLVLELPGDTPSTFINLYLSGYNYASGQHWESVISGYAYTDGANGWVPNNNDNSVQSSGTVPFNTVRFGQKSAATGSGSRVILLGVTGDQSTLWSFADISIDRLKLSYSGANHVAWERGITASFVHYQNTTSLGLSGGLITVPWDGLNGYSAGNYGLGTVTPTALLEVAGTLKSTSLTTGGITATTLNASSLATFVGGITASGITATTLSVQTSLQIAPNELHTTQRTFTQSFNATGSGTSGLTVVGDAWLIGSFSDTPNIIPAQFKFVHNTHTGSNLQSDLYEWARHYFVDAPATTTTFSEWVELPVSISIAYAATRYFRFDVRKKLAGEMQLRMRSTISGVAGGFHYFTFTTTGSTIFTPATGGAPTTTAAPAPTGFHGRQSYEFPVSKGNYGFSGSTAGLFILNSGNVGIGIITPTVALDVVGAAKIKKEALAGTNLSDMNLLSKYSLVLDATTANGSGAASYNGAGIAFAANNTTLPLASIFYGGGGVGGSLNFATSETYGNGLNKIGMTIQQGRVGIGTTTPTVALDVAGAVSTYGDVKLTYPGSLLSVAYSSNDTYRALLGWNTLQLGNNGVNRIVAGNTSVGGSLEFWVNNTTDLLTNSTASNGIQAMTIASSGNVDIAGKVGIGIVSPVSPLHVLGAQNYGGAANSGIVTIGNANNSRQINLGVSDTNSAVYIEGWIPGTGGSNLVLQPTEGGGKVGIGTTTPQGKLHCIGEGFFDYAATATAGGLRLASNSNTSTMAVNEYYDGTNLKFARTGGASSIRMWQTNNSIGGQIDFLVGKTGAANSVISYETAMMIAANKKVGIGTDTPLAVLDVRGPTVTSNATMNHYTDLVAGSIQGGTQANQPNGGATGSCQIILPYGLTAAIAGGTITPNGGDVMLRIKLMGHQYRNSPSTAGASWEVIINAYFASGYHEWSGDHNSVVEIRGNAPFSRVRLANKTNTSSTYAGRAAILLGDDTTTWKNSDVGTRVQVTDVWTHYGNSTNWADGWVIENPLVPQTYISANYVAAMTVTPKIYQYMDMDGNLGLGTTGPTVKLDVVGGIKASTTLNVQGLGTFVGGITASGVTATTLNVLGASNYTGLGTFVGGITASGVTATTLNVLGASNHTGLGTFVGGITASGVTATTLNVGGLGTFVGGITTSGVTATTLNVLGASNHTGLGTFVGGITASGVTATTLNVLDTATVNRMILGSASTGGIVMNVKGKTKYTPGNTFASLSSSYVNNFREYRDLLYIKHSDGDTYGMLVLELPGEPDYTFINLYLSGYNYTSGQHWESVISGYSRTDFVNGWATNGSSSVNSSGTVPFNTVRLGQKSAATGSGSRVILLGVTGDQSTLWSYGEISIDRLKLSYSDANHVAWERGITASFVHYQSTTSLGLSGGLLDVPWDGLNGYSAGNYGIGTTGPTALLEVAGTLKSTSFTTGAITATTLNVLGASNHTGLGTFVGGITASGITATNLNVLNTTTLKDLFVSGNLTFGGTASLINIQSTNVNVADTIMVLGSSGGVGITGDTTNDRGIAFFWNANAAAGSCLGFFGFDRATQNFVFYTSGATTGGGSSGGVTGTFQGNFLGDGITATNLYVSSLGTFIGGITASGVTATTLNVLGASNHTGLGTFVGGITTSGVTATTLNVRGLGTFIGGITTSGVTATTLNVLDTATVNTAIGIGTATPFAVLDVSGPTVTRNVYMNHYTDLVARSVSSGTDNVGQTGACQIILPYGLTATDGAGGDTGILGSDTMLRIKIMGHQYQNSPNTFGASWEVIVNAYFASSYEYWHPADANSVVEIRGNAPFSRVRLANKNHNSTTHPAKAVILLGDDTTTWKDGDVATLIQVTDVWTHYTGNGVNWADGWVIEPGFTLQSYIDTDYAPLMTVTPKIYQYMDMDGNLGIGTTGPTVKLDVVGGIKASTTLNVQGLATFVGGITASGVTATTLNVLGLGTFVGGITTSGVTATTLNVLGASNLTNVRFHDTDRSHFVGFQAPSTVASNITWILPGVTGAAGTVIGTDANQNLSWILPAVVAGSDKQVMFNDAGSLAGNAGFVYNKTTFTIGVSAGIGFGTGWGATLSVDTTGLSGGVSISTKGSTAMYWGATGSVGLVGIGGSTASTPAIVPASTGRLEVNGDIRVAKNGFFVNPNMIITGNCVIGADENAIFAGALTIASGQTLSVGSGGSLIIL